MKISGKHFRTIWLKKNDPGTVQIIDQRLLPHRFVIEDLQRVEDFIAAIRDMHVRGAPLIGATAAYALYVAALNAPPANFDIFVKNAAQLLQATRPTAVNLAYALGRSLEAIFQKNTKAEKIASALQTAQAVTEESVEHCRSIGEHGFALIEKIFQKKSSALPSSVTRPPSDLHHDPSTVQVLTHCNAGWLACVDFGTATAPIYAAHDRGIPVHVWVDETRPRNQGASLTAFELGEHGVPHTVIADNTGGHLMQHGMVDLVIVGTDRTTRCGDVANKIGTYLKALAARDNAVPFYVAAPSSSIDWNLRDGLAEIPIEERDPDEVRYIEGLTQAKGSPLGKGKLQKVLLTPPGSPAANYAFDVTPARLVTGLITERGVCEASEEGLGRLFPEK